MRSVALGLALVADVRIAARDRAAAGAAAEEALAIRRELAAADPDNLSLQNELSGSLGQAGLLRLMAGDRAGAVVLYDENLAICRELVADRPDEKRYQRGLSIALNLVGEARAAGGDRAGACRLPRELADLT